ncbi:hypothetical protein E1301_Tti017645 [Triplophysa tibetana]|uniref:Uncharacterized protein n=1 Tax=Triplophysa tibetana TaxID=1572043 RepID=A0A5A9NHN6_9TELE|nr:hypothetical protein E1301_Tti017645 [Triplophysa tibetana]
MTCVNGCALRPECVSHTGLENSYHGKGAAPGTDKPTTAGMYPYLMSYLMAGTGQVVASDICSELVSDVMFLAAKFMPQKKVVQEMFENEDIHNSISKAEAPELFIFNWNLPVSCSLLTRVTTTATSSSRSTLLLPPANREAHWFAAHVIVDPTSYLWFLYRLFIVGIEATNLHCQAYGITRVVAIISRSRNYIQSNRPQVDSPLALAGRSYIQSNRPQVDSPLALAGRNNFSRIVIKWTLPWPSLGGVTDRVHFQQRNYPWPSQGGIILFLTGDDGHNPAAGGLFPWPFLGAVI